ncbi:MAG: hypothetical protein AVDCRST_MAG56-6631 [uncultured Cytophagales bacterium]|uniref:DUF2911 domain-containing protein n=1 Tax=uncultured Cytophagales bacterium TaxID=158755 RepID=A0A6J4KZ17_9SPHI|nr:MAG: hypothetical protein AVDCRST_MAG56-6631 [uncultured Cytophagales bacterium]
MKTAAKRSLFSTLWVVLVLLSTTAFAQDEDKSKRPSPPAKATGKVGNTTITIDYSRPSVKGRNVWSELAPYGQVWRTGANEATTFEVNNDVTVEGKALPAGKYSLFTIPGENEWTVIFNKEPKQWGAYKYDEKKDALRVTVKPKKAPKMTEQFTINVNKGTVAMLWENAQVDFKVAPSTGGAQ